MTRTRQPSQPSRRTRERSWPGALACLITFIAIASASATMMLQNIGPLTMPDPDMHVFATWAMTTNQSLNPTEIRVDDNGNQLRKQAIVGPVAVLGRGSHMRNAIISSILYDDKKQEVVPKDKAQRSQHRSLTAIMAKDVVTTRSARTNQYFPIAYVPQTVGMRIALSQGLSLWDALTWGRTANLITFMTLSAVAILLAGRWRWAFLVAAANPMSIFCASSLMADATLIALGLLIGALAVYAASRGEQGKRVPALVLIVAGIATIVLASVKIVYLPLIIPFLLLPNRMAAWWRKLLLVLVVVAAVGALTYWWANNYQYVAPSPKTDIEWNRQWMLAHPWDVVLTIGVNLLMYTWRVPFDELFPYTAPIVLAFLLVGRHLMTRVRRDREVDTTSGDEGFIAVGETSALPVVGDVPVSVSIPENAETPVSDGLVRTVCKVLSQTVAIVLRTLGRGVVTAWRWLSEHAMACSFILVYGLSMGATFGALMLTWTNGVTFTRGIAFINGFQGRYLWPLLGMLPLPWLDALLHAKTTTTGNAVTSGSTVSAVAADSTTTVSDENASNNACESEHVTPDSAQQMDSTSQVHVPSSTERQPQSTRPARSTGSTGSTKPAMQPTTRAKQQQSARKRSRKRRNRR